MGRGREGRGFNLIPFDMFRTNWQRVVGPIRAYKSLFLLLFSLNPTTAPRLVCGPPSRVPLCETCRLHRILQQEIKL